MADSVEASGPKRGVEEGKKVEPLELGAPNIRNPGVTAAFVTQVTFLS